MSIMLDGYVSTCFCREDQAPNVVQVLGLVDKGEEVSAPVEVELTPLLRTGSNSRDSSSLRQAKMSIILQNNGELQLGLQTT